MSTDEQKGAILQRDKTSYAIVPHIVNGVVTPEQLRKIAELADKYELSAIKLTSADRIAMIGFKEGNIIQAWDDLGMDPAHATGLCVRSVKVCPGTTFCRLGKQDSLGLGAKLDKRYYGYKLPNKFKIGISGCVNQCAENCIKDLAFVGKTKGWTVHVGGCGGSRAILAQELIAGLTDEESLLIADKVISYFKENGKKSNRLGRLISKVGFNQFKKDIGVN